MIAFRIHMCNMCNGDFRWQVRLRTDNARCCKPTTSTSRYSTLLVWSIKGCEPDSPTIRQDNTALMQSLASLVTLPQLTHFS